MKVQMHLPAVSIQADPHAMEDAFSMFVALQIHRGLFRYSPQGEVLPDLVDSWKLSPDRKTYRFNLKKSIFSDGEPIEAKHVLNSFARIFIKGASIGADLEAIEGSKKFRETNDFSDLGIKVISPDSIEFKLSHPSAIFLKQLAAVDCAVLNISDFDGQYKVTPATPVSGPYRIDLLNTSKVVLKKWRSDPLDSYSPPQSIDISLTDEDAFGLASQNRTDVLDREVLSIEQQSLLKNQGWQQISTELVLERFVVINPNLVPMDIRRYMYQLIDSEELLSELREPGLIPAFGFIPDGMPGSLRREDIAHLRSKIIPPKVTKPFEINLEYGEESRIHRAFSSKLAEIWNGSPLLKVNLKPKRGVDVMQSMFQMSSQVLIGGKGLDYFDGYSVLSYFKSTYQSNYFYIKDPAIDSMLDKALKEEDRSMRMTAYKEIQKEVLKHYTVIPLSFGSSAVGLWSSSFSYVPAHPGGLHTLPMETVVFYGK